MMRKVLLAFSCIAIVFLVFSCCNDIEKSKNASGKYIHMLDWRINDESGLEDDNAIYIFDDQEVGKGEAGFQCIMDRITSLPRGSVVIISVSDIDMLMGANSTKTYPFSLDTLRKCANDSGILLCCLAR